MQWKKLDDGQRNVYRWRCERARILDRLLKEDKRITYAEALKQANREMAERDRERRRAARAGEASKAPLENKIKWATGTKYVIPAGTPCVVLARAGGAPVQHRTRKKLTFAAKRDAGAMWEFDFEGYTIRVEPQHVRCN